MRLSGGTMLTAALMGVLALALLLGDGAWSWSWWAAWLLGALSATLLHEAGHAVAARLVGVEVDELRVTLVGGAVTYAGEPDAAQRAAVSIGGPAASALGTLAGLAVAVLDGSAQTFVGGLAGVSTLALVANLVPVGGTDGAELLRALRAGRFSRT